MCNLHMYAWQNCLPNTYSLNKVRYFQTLLLFHNYCGSTTLPKFSVVSFNEFHVIYWHGTIHQKYFGFQSCWENWWVIFNLVIVNKFILKVKKLVKLSTNWLDNKLTSIHVSGNVHRYGSIQSDKFFFNFEFYLNLTIAEQSQVLH